MPMTEHTLYLLWNTKKHSVISMNPEVLEKYKKAGAIAKQVLEYGKALAREGVPVLELAEKIEGKIIELGGEIAFPVNIGINETAAHFTPLLEDNRTIKAEDYVKIDVGVHIDGYIGDTAATVRAAGKDELIVCSEKMLEAALKLFTPGTRICEIGEVIENTAREFGFNPVRNLTGHGLEQYNLHAGITVPNIKNENKRELKEGEVYAVEPFCTEGSGFVKDCQPALIFSYVCDAPVRMPEARRIMHLAKVEYKKLPFAKRWLQKSFSPLKLDMAIKQIGHGLHPYAQLKEVSGKPVAQSEHTVIVEEKPVVITNQ